jgi:hypothetical protein
MQRLMMAVVATLVILTATPSYAQLEFGVIGGVNFTSISGLDDLIADDEDDVDVTASTGNRTGFKAGVYLRSPITEVLSIQPSFVYSQSGATAQQTFSDFGVDLLNLESTLKIDYFSIPVPIRFDVPTSGGIRPFVLAGPYFAFKTSAKQDFDFDISQELRDEFGSDFDEFFEEIFGVGPDGGETDLEDVKTFDWGLVFGGGVSLNRMFAVGVDYSLGLMNLNDDEDDDHDLKNRALSVFVTVNLFPR